jgi:hypothetical protein
VRAPSSDAQVAVALVRKHSRALAAAAIVLALAAAAVVFVLVRRDPEPSSESSDAVPSLADLQVTQLTTSGNAERAAISPDGRYVAYVQHDGDDYSLWIRQATTTSNLEIVPPVPGMMLLGVTFRRVARAISRRHPETLHPQRGQSYFVVARRSADRVPPN